MLVRFYLLIILYWTAPILFAYALISLLPLELNVRNYGLCYAYIIGISGIMADCVYISNKPFRSPEKLLEEYPDDWSSPIPSLELLNFGKMCQVGYEFYSLGNKNYQDPNNWTWNQEISHFMGVSIYFISILLLKLKQTEAFKICLLFGGLSLCFNYTYYIFTTIYELMNDYHKDTPVSKMLISWGYIDIPYMIITGYYVLWYAYTSLNKVKAE